MLSLDTIYIYRVGNREFEIIPNYEGSDKEFFHILERVPKEGDYSFIMKEVKAIDYIIIQ